MKLSKFSIKKYREIIYKYTLVNLNLRSEKSTGGNIIATIPKGTKVQFNTVKTAKGLKAIDILFI